MRTAGNKAFTMVELLIVIMIISILATLVIPSVIRAIALAKQAACNTNIQNILMGLKQYSNPSEEMPIVPQSSQWSWNTKIGTSRGSNPFTTVAGRNHSANLWLLAREDHVGLAAFVCPGTTDIPNDREEVKNYWDFKSSLRISYGLQSPYGWDGSLSILTPEGVVLVADGSPYVEPSAGNNPGKIDTKRSVVDWGNDAGDGDEMRLWGNSPNHETEGQNVGYNDGRAEWKTAANCGKDGDNIYTATNHRTNTSAGGNLTAGIKNNENDTLILP